MESDVPILQDLFVYQIEGEDAQGEYDKLRRRVLWSMPYGLYLVGSRAGARRNMMTLNWATQVSFEPKLVRKRQRRLGGVDEMVISLRAKGLRTRGGPGAPGRGVRHRGLPGNRLEVHRRHLG